MFKHRRRLITLLITLIMVINLIFVPISLAAPIDEVRELLTKNYVDNVAPDTLKAASIEEMLKKLGDPYTNYLTQDQYKELVDSLSDIKSVTGVGIYFEPCPEGIVVLQVVPNSPAQAAGIKKGDIITGADDKALAGLSTETCIALITGPENTSVKLAVLRDNHTLIYNLIRKQIIISSVNSEIIDQHIGYIKLDNFGTETNNHISNTLADTSYQSVDHWIIDVRENPGGYLDTVLDTLGFFIDSNISVLVKDKQNDIRGAKAREAANQVNKPVFLLVDESSASAAEILAAALKDYNSALIIGRQTFGKGSVQTMAQLSDGSTLKLTISKFYSPRGNTINKVGVQPHLVIKEADPQLVAVLLSGTAPAADKTGYLSLRLAGQTYEISLQQALSADLKPAFTELLWSLPPTAVLMQGSSNGWDYTTVSDIARKYELGNDPRSFTDIQQYQNNKLKLLTSHLLLSGYPDRTFKPDRSITRAELAAMIVSTIGLKTSAEQESFTDVGVKSWYAPAVAALKQTGIATGYSGRFYPEQTATQEEVVAMLVRTSEYLNGLSSSEDNSTPVSNKQISSWASKSVAEANSLGIISGVSTFNGYLPAKRGDTAVMLANILERAGIL